MGAPWEDELSAQQPQASNMAPWDEEMSQEHQPNIISRIGSDYTQRVANAQDLANRSLDANGNPSDLKQLEMGAQLVGGPIADVGKEVASSIYNATAAPSVKAGMQQIGNLISPVTNAVSGAYKQLPQDVQDVGNMIGTSLQAAGTMKPITAVSNLGPTVGDAASTLGNAAMATAKVPIQGASDILSGVTSTNPQDLGAISEGLYKNAGDLYKKMRAVGATLNQNSSADLSGSIDKALSDPNFIPELNPKTIAIANKIKSVAANGQIGIDNLDQYRRLLGRIGGSEDGVSAGVVKAAIDNHVNNLTGENLLNGDTSAVDLLNQGRKTYQQASKFDDVSTILENAMGDPNKIKAGLTKFMQKEGNTAGWSKDELAAGWNAAQTGGVEKLLKMGGKFGIDLGTSVTPGNTVAPLLGALVAGAHSGGVGAILAPVAGTIAKQGQKWLARGKAESLLDAIKSGPMPKVPEAAPQAAPLQITGPGATMYADSMGNVSRTPNPSQEIVQVGKANNIPQPSLPVEKFLTDPTMTPYEKLQHLNLLMSKMRKQ